MDSYKLQEGTIKCPHCGELVPINSTMHKQLAETLQEELRFVSAPKRRLGCAAETGRERVEVFNVGTFELMKIEVEDSDLHHVDIIRESHCPIRSV